MFASRFALTLSALGLLAAAGVMGAAGPDNKRNDLSVRVEIGDRDHAHGWHGRPGGWNRHPGPVIVAPAPVVVAPRPVVVVQPPAVVLAEVAPRSLEVQAFQAGDTVMILARGENTASGFTTSLERESDWRRDGTTRVTLHNVGPTNCAAQVCTPFAISGGFETRERLTELRICIAGEERCVQVQQVTRIN